MTSIVEQLSATTLLRFATAGSVDDGKSTLVGRLLYDSKSVLTDELEAVEQLSLSRGQEAPDLTLLTDGLRAEREQGITIDVAYRYFATIRRRFVLADTPGHVQYTRNMVTGASTAELAVVLVDARNGVVEQTRRHTAVAALLRVPHVVLAVNKMDLVDYAEPVFAAIAEEFTGYATFLGVPEITAIPISALAGDNVVKLSAHMDWYGGPTVLEHLETVPISHDLTACHARFPVQYVIRPQSAEHPDYRGYAGQIAAGVFRVGQAVSVLPSGHTTTITGIDALGENVDVAWAPQSVTLRLADDIDISRGDLIATAADAPPITQDVEATVCHVADQPLSVGQRVLLKHTTRTVRAIVKDIPSRLTLDDLSQHPAPGQLLANDIGRVVVRTAEPLALDAYVDSRRTGSFLLIDPADGTTLSGGMAGAAFTCKRNVTRTIELLAELGRLDDDRADPLDQWLERNLACLPTGIRIDVADWMDVLRNGNSRRRPKAELTWKNYLLQVRPTLLSWSTEHGTLREISKAEVVAALEAPTPFGGDGHTRLTALRSLFAFLKAQQKVFADPTRRLDRRVTRRPGQRIPTRLPASVLDEIGVITHTPATWLVTVLTGHHALGAVHLQALALEDVDLPNRRMTVQGQPRPLDDLTHQAIQRYLDYRTRRWPSTANPHLLITQQTAHHDSPVSRWWLRTVLRGQEASLDLLRQDRILDEVEAVGVRDPLHIAAVFGLRPDTAQRYVDAVYGRHDPTENL